MSNVKKWLFQKIKFFILFIIVYLIITVLSDKLWRWYKDELLLKDTLISAISITLFTAFFDLVELLLKKAFHKIKQLKNKVKA